MQSIQKPLHKLHIFSLVIAALFAAACDSNQPTASIVNKPSPSSSADSREQEQLFRFAQTGDNVAIKSFLERGINVNLRGPDGATAVMEAAYAGHTPTVKLLLDYGADLSAKKKDGASAPTLTVQKDLVELFADVTTLVDAAREGNNDVVKRMIAKGTPVNAVDRNGYTALTEASWNGRVDTIKLLLASGANPKIKKADGSTPLDMAMAQKQDAAAAVLKEALAKPPSPAPTEATK